LTDSQYNMISVNKKKLH